MGAGAGPRGLRPRRLGSGGAVTLNWPAPDGDDDAICAALADAVVRAPRPGDAMLATLETLDERQDLAMQAAVFESASWRADVGHYWVYFRMSRVYADLGRSDAATLTAAMAARMQPDWPATIQPMRLLFERFFAQGRPRAALDVFLCQLRRTPEAPAAEPHDIEALFRTLGLPPRAETAPSRPGLRRDHAVAEAEQRGPTPVRVLGGAAPAFLQELESPREREPIRVAELADGELLICNDAVAVRDADGVLQPDLSVAHYPGPVARKVLGGLAQAAVEQRDVAEAVLIADGFPAPNLAHFLLDQATRLALYARAGVDLANATVVGPEITTVYQGEIARRAGLAQTLGTRRVARVTARRLWVSTNCRALQHIGHLAAPWAIEYARAVLSGCGGKGARLLYVSRADAAARRVRDEAGLVSRLTSLGFETIVPGRLSYDDQLAAFRAASHVVAVHGAALAHLVLCPPGARVLEIFHPRYGTAAFAQVATACGLDYTALIARDGESDDPALNDASDVTGAGGGYGERDVRVDADAIARWVREL